MSVASNANFIKVLSLIQCDSTFYYILIALCINDIK